MSAANKPRVNNTVNKRQLMQNARGNVSAKKRPIELIRLLVKEQPTLTLKVIQSWLKSPK